MRSLAGHLNFLFRKSGAGRNRFVTPQILYKRILWQKGCVPIGVFTIRGMAILMFIYWLPCVHLRKITHGEIKKSKTGLLSGIRMEILRWMKRIRIGGRIRRIQSVVVFVFRYWMQMEIRNWIPVTENNGKGSLPMLQLGIIKKTASCGGVSGLKNVICI